MKTSWFLAVSLAVTGLLAGCESPLPPGTERGPHNTIAYDVLIDASPPGARIEAEGNNLGNTPVHLKIFGDRDGKGFRPIHRFKAHRHAVEKVAPTRRTFGEEFYRELHDAP